MVESNICFTSKFEFPTGRSHTCSTRNVQQQISTIYSYALYRQKQERAIRIGALTLQKESCGRTAAASLNVADEGGAARDDEAAGELGAAEGGKGLHRAAS